MPRARILPLANLGGDPAQQAGLQSESLLAGSRGLV